MQEKLSSVLTHLGSLRGLVFVFGQLCLIAAVGFAFLTGKLLFQEIHDTAIGPKDLGEIQEWIDQKIKQPLTHYDVIIARNVFGAVEKPVEVDREPTTPPPTDLKLRLVGTYVGAGDDKFAIIEDTAKSEQDAFEREESIFGKAKLIDVFPQSVKIEHGGKTEMLALEEGSGSLGASEEGGISQEGNEFQVAEAELEEALANLPRLLSQARAVPYFRNGESVGMRLFAIRKGSLYEKLGLKNGDIIKAVNSNSVSDPTQALKIFEMLKEERSIKVVIERRGEESTLTYDIG